MRRISQEILDHLREFDSPTLFNAVTRLRGAPGENYTDHSIRCLLPELGAVIGYAITAEITTNDPDSPALDWLDYYALLEGTPGPLIAVLKDVDSRPGRGASFGDGMATVHQRLGVTGVLVDGTVRDLAGIRRVGLPVFAWGTVPGHGAFHLTRFNHPLTVGQLRVRPGDLLLADQDGCVQIPAEHAAEVLRLAHQVRTEEEAIFASYRAADFSVEKMRKQRGD
ncbi:MAG: RraA family protein [Candidatus Latescibacteria bacterium]|nr:RraA family protein [Candidatus Latescibacterota bacterium]